MNVLRIINGIIDKCITEETLRIGEGLSFERGNLVVVSGDAALINTLRLFRIRCHYIPKQLWYLMGIISKLADIIRDEGIDIIESMDELSAVHGFFVSRRTGKYFITNFFGQRITRFSRVIGWGKYTIVQTKENGRQLIEAFDIPHHRIRFVPLGVQIGSSAYQIPGVDKSIAILLSPPNTDDNNADIVRVISRVSKFISDIKVTILLNPKKGGKRFRDNILHLIKRYDATRVIRLIDPYGLHSAQVCSSTILLLNDCADIANLKFLIEAGSKGVAVIARKERGALDIIKDGENGLLVSWEDERTIVSTILKVLRDKALADSLSKKLKAYVAREHDCNKAISIRLNVYKEAISTQKVLVSHHGAGNIIDIIRLCPILKTIREKFPDAHVAVLGESKYRNLLRSQGAIDEVITRPRHRNRGALRRFYAEVTMLQRDYYDIGFNIGKSHASLREGWLNRLFLRLICVKRLYSKSEIEPQAMGTHPFRLDIPDSCKSYIDEFLSKEWVGVSQPIMGLNIGIGKCRLKGWHLENFVRLSDEAAKRFSLRVVLTGTRDEVHDAAEFVRFSRTRPINAVGKTSLIELAALINRFCVYVTADTLPLYIACAVGTPTIAISGPTDPRASLPLVDKDKLAVLKKDLQCSPCNKRRCSDPVCMREITPEDVLGALGVLIRR